MTSIHDILSQLDKHDLGYPEWVDTCVALCVALAQVRKSYNRFSFNAWWTEQRFKMAAYNRNAAITMGADPERCRAAFQAAGKICSIESVYMTHFKRKTTKDPAADRAYEVLKERIARGDKDLDAKRLAKETGVGSHTAFEKAAYRIKHETLAGGELPPLPKGGETVIAAHKAKLDREYQTRRLEETMRVITENTLPEWEKQKAHYHMVIKSRKGVFTQAEYNVIMKCLHPDTGKHVDDATRSQAFQMLRKHKVALMSEKEHPTNYEPLPKTAEELIRRARAAKQKARA